RTTAVDHISFEVEKGQIVGFLGPNGAGKTTTMRMLTCFLPPTSGAASVAGFDVLEQPVEVKKRIGYLPEMPPLYQEMRTTEYLQHSHRAGSGADLRAGHHHHQRETGGDGLREQPAKPRARSGVDARGSGVAGRRARYHGGR